MLRMLAAKNSRKRIWARAPGGGDKGGSGIDYEGREVVQGFTPNGIILICFLLMQ
jgi:hypothetical protein